GSVMVPNVESPLRDSGLNTPVGGALSIDFRGNPRIVNTTMDRGAIEAEAPPQVGPLITPNSPAAGSTTLLIGEPGGGPAFGNISFNTSGGTAPGTTQIDCQVSSGTLQIGANPTQVVGVGQTPGAVLVGFDSTATPQSGVIFCQFFRAGVAGTTFAAYTFKAGPELLFKNGFE
ncbi:MAG TPA: choice-of-anchor Q domain-containing protein, partial [Xanthomonadales bacterium]|nr:choice-of-anchor Q domain-containing protein [Xanthomonadales bacterium]